MKNNVVCPECGVTVKPRGLGSHRRLKHGIIERLVFRYADSSGDSSGDLSTQVNDLSTQVDHLSAKVSDLQTNNLSDLSGDLNTNMFDLSTQVDDLSTQVKRPSDFIRKGTTVEKQILKTVTATVIYVECSQCKKKLELPANRFSKPFIDIYCNECLTGGYFKLEQFYKHPMWGVDKPMLFFLNPERKKIKWYNESNPDPNPSERIFSDDERMTEDGTTFYQYWLSRAKWIK